MLEEILLFSNVTTLLLFVLVFLLVSYWTTRPADIPPGPSPIFPLLGNIPSLIGRDVLPTFRNMRHKYGDIFSLYMGNQLIIVINGYTAIKEALVKRGSVFSDRPQNFLSKELKEGYGIISTSGDLWREQRSFAMTSLQELGFGRASFEQNIMREIHTLLDIIRSQKEKPFDLKEFIHTSVANVMCGILFGKLYKHEDKEFKTFITDIEEGSRILGNASVVLNCFPALKYLPGDPFKMKKVKRGRDMGLQFFARILKEHDEAYDENNLRDFTDFYLKKMKEMENKDQQSTFTRTQFLHILGDLFGAGSETSATTIRWTFIYLLRNPDIQRKLTEEIDCIVGRHRLPCLEDRKNMHYLEATIMEVLRIANVAPLAIPHTTPRDIMFQGYKIPGGSSVIINLDSIFKDPSLWDNSEEFRPERFLDSDGHVNKPEEFIPFSTGRRICLGESVARMELFLFLSAMFHQFEFRLPEGSEPPDTRGTLGLTYMPKSFLMVAREHAR